jgi:hypothetical protein
MLWTPKPRLDLQEIEHWAERYAVNDLELRIEADVAPRARTAGLLDAEDFLALCEWKSVRILPRCRKNPESRIRELTRYALSSAQDESVRIDVLTLLSGVRYPVASVILHFCHRDPYPILDFRALWSLGIEEPDSYTFEFWRAFVRTCRGLAEATGLPMRTVDRALWQFGKERMPKR